MESLRGAGKKSQLLAYTVLSDCLGIYPSVLSFASFGSEIHLWPLNEVLAARGALVLPYIEGHQLRLFRVDDLLAN